MYLGLIEWFDTRYWNYIYKGVPCKANVHFVLNISCKPQQNHKCDYQRRSDATGEDHAHNKRGCWPWFLFNCSQVQDTLIHTLQHNSMWYVCMYATLGPILLTVFSSQFKFDGNFVPVSPRFKYSDHNKMLYMAWQTAVLSWHVQNFFAKLWWPTMELHQSEVSIEFELWAIIHLWNGPWLTGITADNQSEAMVENLHWLIWIFHWFPEYYRPLI